MKKLLLSLLLPFSCSINAINTSSVACLGIAAVPAAASLFFGGVALKEIFVGKNDGWRGARIILSTGMAGCCAMIAAGIAEPVLDIEYEAVSQEPVYILKRINGIK